MLYETASQAEFHTPPILSRCIPRSHCRVSLQNTSNFWHVSPICYPYYQLSGRWGRVDKCRIRRFIPLRKNRPVHGERQATRRGSNFAKAWRADQHILRMQTTSYKRVLDILLSSQLGINSLYQANQIYHLTSRICSSTLSLAWLSRWRAPRPLLIHAPPTPRARSHRS